MKLETRTHDHGMGPFTVHGVPVGSMFVQEVLCVDDNGNNYLVYRISHAKTLFLMPKYFAQMENAMSAAKEIDALIDWDAFVTGQVLNPDHNELDLNRRVIEICRKHNGED